MAFIFAGGLVSAQSSHMGVLAFIQGRNLWVKELPDGQSKPLTVDGRNCCPRWSPSGRWLAYRKEVNELSPKPVVEWLDYYGYINWDYYFDWWRDELEE